MSGTGRLQLALPLPSKGILTIVFQGKSSIGDVEMFKQAIDAQLMPGTRVKKAVFDLSKIDRVMNAAGRLLDLACYYQKSCKIPIEVRIPEEIYSILHEITPDEMPAPPVKRAAVRGVFVTVIKPEPVESVATSESLSPEFAYALAPEAKTVLSCSGKVRAVNGAMITVSLFVDGQEVIGEFDRAQFPAVRIIPGMMFDYQAIVAAPGKTEISIDFYTEQHATLEELEADAVEIANEVKIFP